MSSNIALSRTRSLRRPDTTTTAGRGGGGGSTSPSRLPMKPPARSATITSTVGAGTRSATRALASAMTGSATASSRTRAATTTTTTTSTQIGGATATTRRRASPTESIASNTSSGTSQSTATAGTTKTKSARALGRAPSTRYAAPSGSSTASGSTTTTATGGARPRSSSGAVISSVAQSRVTAVGGSSRGGLGHARAKSSATALTSATTLRPVVVGGGATKTTAGLHHGLGPPASVTAASRLASATTTTSSRVATRSQQYVPGSNTSRVASHGRTESAASASSSSLVSTSAPGGASSAPSTTSSQPQQQRPAFNTHQQHYSPLKSHAPKPLTSTFLAPPSPSKLPANVAISAETSRLQTELLQLSLLHRDAGPVRDEWAASARAKLESRFDDVSLENRQLAELERREAEGHNIAALLRWADSAADTAGGVAGEEGLSLEDKIQALDQVLAGVWALSGGEQYARVTAAFEAWAEQVADVLVAQRGGAAEDLLDASDEVLFVSELDPAGWKNESAALARRLDGWRRSLRGLGRVPAAPAAAKMQAQTSPPARSTKSKPSTSSLRQQQQHQKTKPSSHRLHDPETGKSSGSTAQQQQQQQQGEAASSGGDASGLERIIAGCETMVGDMLAELALMEQIERDALQAESDWILRVNREFRGGDHDDHPPPRDVIATPSASGADAVPLWKM
ncbi:hypothetical protein MN608_02156 [Microdochium nivale]|nr:hypothetical protein MN608_02156 [Microdochium nivale]